MSDNNRYLERWTKNGSDNLRINAVAITLSVIAFLVGALGATLLASAGVASTTIGLYVVAMVLIGVYIMLGLKIASQWEKAVVLRFGKFHGLYGPGIFWIVPIIDTIAQWIDHRVMVTPFSAEKTLTKDTVPVDVDAVLFWMVWDAEKASLEVEEYRVAIAWAAQTALREVIGQMSLADILVGRAKMDAALVIVPSSAVDTMNLGGLSGMVSLSQTSQAVISEEE